MASAAHGDLGALVEYLDRGELRTGLVVREHNDKLAIRDRGGRETMIPRDLVLLRHVEHRPNVIDPAIALEEIADERARLKAALDLNLLWEVAHEQPRAFSAAELAELFFGHRNSVATAAMLDALLNDRIYFVRRHLEFLARDPDQVERLRIQNDRLRQRSDDYRKRQDLIRRLAGGQVAAPSDETATLVAGLRRYLDNPFARDSDLTAMLSHVAPDQAPAEVAFSVLERLGAAPPGPRFAIIGGLRTRFSDAALDEAARALAGSHPACHDAVIFTIDDDETLEVDDALSCEPLPDGGLRVRVHIALVADFVARGGAMDMEAAARASTVYLPEATIRMLPDEVSCRRASLIANEARPVLTTDIQLSPAGDILASSIYPAAIRIGARLSYDKVGRILADDEPDVSSDLAAALRQLNQMAERLRARRRTDGANLVSRRESKVKVGPDGEIEVGTIDNSAPSRLLVAEFMVLSNFVAARYAVDHRVPIIYRVQPDTGSDYAPLRPRLSLHPDFHAGVGLDCYAQLSSPIRRYADLVMQRQLLAALANKAPAYTPDEMLAVLANLENTEMSAKELERRAKRYWILRLIERKDRERPLEAWVWRDGATAELCDYAVRATMRGAPELPNQERVLVRVARVDPDRGWLAVDFIRTLRS